MAGRDNVRMFRSTPSFPGTQNYFINLKRHKKFYILPQLNIVVLSPVALWWLFASINMCRKLKVDGRKTSELK
jgi:hypothetical protein